MNYADEIKRQVSMLDVSERYGLQANNNGFASCPFHNEKTPSMKLYSGDKGFYCFGCGASGDVIKFIQMYFNIPFKDALKKINDDFGLNLPIGRKMSERQRLAISKESFKRKQEREAQKTAYFRLLKNFLDAHSEIIRFEQPKAKYKPKTQDEELHPLFLESLKKQEQAYFNLECAEMELMKWKTK